MTLKPERGQSTAAVRLETAAVTCTALVRSGDACPACGVGRMDYDGLLNLACPECGYTAGYGGAFT